MHGSKGGTGVLGALENHKAIGFPRNTAPDALEIRKMPDLIWTGTVQYFDGIPEYFKV